MEWQLTEEDYYQYQIAREGNDKDYGTFDGYVAIVKENKAAIVYSSHCSCYRTWDNGQLEYADINWMGTKAQLLKIAKKKEDIDLQGRVVNAEDYKGKQLLDLYESILKWGSKSK